MPDSYDMWIQFNNTVPSAEYLDYGFSDTTSYKDFYEADIIGHVSELPSDVEIGTPPKQYGDMGRYGEDSGISFLNMSEEEYGKLYSPVEDGGPLGDFLDPVVTNQMSEIPSLSELERIANIVAKFSTAAGSIDPIFGGERSKRDLRRAAAAQPGSIPGGVGLSGARATETRADMINRQNIKELFGPARRTGIDARYALGNVPQARPVSIPTGTIGTTSRKRSIYGK
jgi:hypothetical protein|tara:strand:+ start:620 stop:1300 length:681 start_codon:yes stop_codon:yes gene_type:complete